ncbi:hypothetical protein AB1N83_002250 [Pleurotus pulmonarius]
MRRHWVPKMGRNRRKLVDRKSRFSHTRSALLFAEMTRVAIRSLVVESKPRRKGSCKPQYEYGPSIRGLRGSAPARDG